ncbi:MAG: ABC transporter substrate-binding protein [Firmicutes bacterium]|nr:ABC transporter substrate-binding protein [Bacillota bacterium]
MNKKIRVLLGVVLVLAAMAVSMPVQSSQDSPKKVRLMLDWTPNTNHTGIYVALEKGWFRQEGLDVQIISPTDVSVEAVVGAGRAEFGISFQEIMTSARVQGVPVVSIAAVIQHNTSGFAALKTRGIAKAGDFAGHTYGGWGLPIEEAIIDAMMRRDGADPRTVKRVNIGTGDLLGMLERDIDFAWIFYGWQGIEAKQRGLDIRYVPMSDYQDAVPDYYTPVIITSERLTKSDPNLAKRFMSALAQGYTYAAANPAEGATILLKHAPELSPELVRASQAWLSPRYIADASQWGHQDPLVWRRFGEWMLKNRLIDRPFDYRSAFTNEFLPGR